MADLIQRLRTLGAAEAEEIEARFPKQLRRVGGYDSDALTPAARANGRGNLARLLVGSEGTLAFSAAIELVLHPVKPRTHLAGGGHGGQGEGGSPAHDGAHAARPADYWSGRLCGMAGTLGYQRETEAVSRAMAEGGLLQAVRAAAGGGCHRGGRHVLPAPDP
nr:hypothetical protein [uncultured Rhodopila sp.]